MAHPKHEEVRQRYSLCCGYCGVSESEAGGEFTVDHYRPISAGGDDSADNLVYACFKCNQYKGAYFPDSSRLSLGQRVLHPLRDDVSEHLRENERMGRLDPLTETGRFHIGLLQLNRAPLVQYRLQRRLDTLLEAENDHLRSSITALRDYLVQLGRLLGRPGGEDE